MLHLTRHLAADAAIIDNDAERRSGIARRRSSTLFSDWLSWNLGKQDFKPSRPLSEGDEEDDALAADPDAVEVSAPDGPRPDEILFCLAMACGGRIHSRMGGLEAWQVKGEDGLR